VIYILDADLNGTDSYQFLVDAKLVTHIPVPTYEVYDQAIRWLISNCDVNADVVVLDTISQQAYATRGDARFGTDASLDMWDKRTLFLDGDKNYLTLYEMAGQMIMRRLRNLRATGVRVIATAHEASQDDQMITKLAPSMNKALYGSLRSATSDIFRMWMLPSDILAADGSVRYPTGTRVVSVKPSPTYVAKYHVDPFGAQSIPVSGNIVIETPMVPVLPKVYSYLKKKPTFLCLYGEQGVGKTTAAVSEAFELFLGEKHPDLLEQAKALYCP
jgi:hypothetical protein